MADPRPARRSGTRLAAVLTALVVASGGLVLGSAAPGQADDAPTLSFDIDPALPIQVNRSPVRPEQIDVDVLVSAPVADVTVAVSGPELSLTQSSYALDEVTPARPGHLPLVVGADTGGLHGLTLTASAPGVADATIELTIFSSGGAPVPGHDSLAGRAYATDGTYTDYSTGEDGSGARYSTVLTFVDATHATSGLPGHLATACAGKAAAGCLRYHYDASTGLVQVGDNIIGQLRSGAAYFDGAVPEVHRETGGYFEGARLRRLTFPSAGHRFAGTWTFHSPFNQGVHDQRLTLRKGGTYSLAVRAGVGYSDSYDGQLPDTLRRDWSGRYQLGSGGRLVLRDASGQRTLTVARLAVASSDDGTPRPGTLGVELQLSLKIAQGSQAGSTLVDGNLLHPRP